MIRPIFFDPTGRRGLWARRLLAGALLLILLAAFAFATTLVAVPSEGDLALPLPTPHAARLSGISPLRRGNPSWLPRGGGPCAQADPRRVVQGRSGAQGG